MLVRKVDVILGLYFSYLYSSDLLFRLFERRILLPNTKLPKNITQQIIRADFPGNLAEVM
jgi:hypothetical protein